MGYKGTNPREIAEQKSLIARTNTIRVCYVCGLKDSDTMQVHTGLIDTGLCFAMLTLPSSNSRAEIDYLKGERDSANNANSELKEKVKMLERKLL